MGCIPHCDCRVQKDKDAILNIAVKNAAVFLVLRNRHILLHYMVHSKETYSNFTSPDIQYYIRIFKTFVGLFRYKWTKYLPIPLFQLLNSAAHNWSVFCEL